METLVFNKIVRSRNIQYKKLFNYIPCITEYTCTREEYIAALDMALKDNKELDYYLSKYVEPMSEDAEI
ncbi:MAG: hypothetical protein MR936_09605 [Eubacterium sp.]|nr:hypothetical protein [Eubacterium sp.]